MSRGNLTPLRRSEPSYVGCYILILVLLLVGAAIDSVTAAVVVPYGSNWKYFVGTGEASSPNPTAWRAIEFDDDAWPTVATPIGYGQPGIATTIPSSASSNYTSVYLRKIFTIQNPGEILSLSLSARIDDGCAAWINGVEVRRFNVPSGELPFNAVATFDTQAPFQIGTRSNLNNILVAGQNVIAIQAFNSSVTNSDLLVDVSLASTFDYVPPTLSIVTPPLGSTIRELSQIEAVFSEPVTGVEAADLLVNGNPATNLQVRSATQYALPVFPVGDGVGTGQLESKSWHPRFSFQQFPG